MNSCYGSTIHNSQKMEITQNSIVVYAYNGILSIFSLKIEWNIDTCYSMDESKNIILRETS